jgi:prepilin-type processing-associated H-X9-DG protein
MPDCREMRARSGAEAGFTRGDLAAAVVGVTLAVLAVAPWIARAGPTDLILACLANHRVLTGAWMAYAEDHQGLLPANYFFSDTATTVAAHTYQTWANNLLDWTTAASNTNLTYARSGVLKAYLTNDAAVFKCPADTFLSSAQKAKGWSGRARSYSMSVYLGKNSPTEPAANTGVNSFGNYRQFLDLTSIPNPAGQFVFLDEHPDSINDGQFVIFPTGSAQPFLDLPASYHGNACGFGFADGHAEMHQWASAAMNVPVSYVTLVIPNLTAVRSDYAYTANRATAPITAVSVANGGAGQLQVWWSPAASTYRLQSATNLAMGPWTNVPGTPVKGPASLSMKAAAGSGTGFFRLKSP